MAGRYRLRRLAPSTVSNWPLPTCARALCILPFHIVSSSKLTVQRKATTMVTETLLCLSDIEHHCYRFIILQQPYYTHCSTQPDQIFLTTFHSKKSQCYWSQIVHYLLLHLYLTTHTTTVSHTQMRWHTQTYWKRTNFYTYTLTWKIIYYNVKKYVYIFLYDLNIHSFYNAILILLCMISFVGGYWSSRVVIISSITKLSANRLIA